MTCPLHLGSRPAHGAFLARCGRLAGLTAAIVAGFPAPPAEGVELRLTDPGRRELLSGSPSVAGGALGGLVNPAAWATSGDGELAFWWDDRTFEEGVLDDWGILHSGGLGFSAERRTFRIGGERFRVHDYQVGFAVGDRRSHAGLAWRWAAGDDGPARRESGLAFGTLFRPGPKISFGWTAFLSAESRRRSALVDVGVRPFASPVLTLFGDYSLTSEDRPDEGIWSAGLDVRPVRGLHLDARIREAEDPRDDVEIQLGFGITLDRLGLRAAPRLREGGDRISTTYLVRAGTPFLGWPVGERLERLGGGERWARLDLENRVITYQRDQWFDEKRVAWIDLARRLARLRADDGIDGVALNLSGMRLPGAIAWELRRELEKLQESGKLVAIYVDELRMGGMYLVSVADHLSIDPLGHLSLAGLAAHRTYMKGLLDKLGLGFEEHRYFRFKSANETYTRDSMSDPDREQLARMIELVDATIRSGIGEARGLSPGALDAIVEDLVLVTPSEALDAGLVDAVGRWPDVEDWVKERGGRFVPAGAAEPPAPDERWGPPPTVALVYAIGPCAMDTGIRGRATSAHLRRLAKRPDVAAVVLRADSPGGLPQPSDLVAEGMAKVREANRPAVVSQGDVAASGGYWLGLSSDRTFTTPFTVTGSIGVISGWVWDEGVGEKTGFSADGIQRGSHADLFTGIRYPGIGVRLPRRNLRDDERARVRALTMELYDGFVGKVAASRDLPEDRVRELAEGRVWMGEDAIRLGLVDEAGTLLDAVEEAARLAGIVEGAELTIEEFPPRRRFRLPKLAPGIPGISWIEGALERTLLNLMVGPVRSAFGGDPVALPAGAATEEPSAGAAWALDYLRLVAESPGTPLLATPPGLLPDGLGR